MVNSRKGEKSIEIEGHTMVKLMKRENFNGDAASAWPSLSISGTGPSGEWGNGSNNLQVVLGLYREKGQSQNTT